MTDASKIADDELIEAVQKALAAVPTWDGDTFGYDYTTSELNAAARAIIPIVRKHYAEVFAKVAEGYDCECDQSPDCMCWWTGVPAAIRQAGEAQ